MSGILLLIVRPQTETVAQNERKKMTSHTHPLHHPHCACRFKCHRSPPLQILTIKTTIVVLQFDRSINFKLSRFEDVAGNGIMLPSTST